MPSYEYLERGRVPRKLRRADMRFPTSARRDEQICVFLQFKRLDLCKLCLVEYAFWELLEGVNLIECRCEISTLEYM